MFRFKLLFILPLVVCVTGQNGGIEYYGTSNVRDQRAYNQPLYRRPLPRPGQPQPALNQAPPTAAPAQAAVPVPVPSSTLAYDEPAAPPYAPSAIREYPPPPPPPRVPSAAPAYPPPGAPEYGPANVPQPETMTAPIQYRPNLRPLLQPGQIRPQVLVPPRNPDASTYEQPQPALQLEPVPQPEPALQQEPNNLEPKLVPEEGEIAPEAPLPVPVPQYEPVPQPEPVLQEQPNVQPEPLVEPMPDILPPQPVPEIEPIPQPEYDYVPQPEPAPQPQPDLALEPVPVPEPQTALQPQPAIQPESIPQPQPDRELQPTPALPPGPVLQPNREPAPAPEESAPVLVPEVYPAPESEEPQVVVPAAQPPVGIGAPSGVALPPLLPKPHADRTPDFGRHPQPQPTYPITTIPTPPPPTQIPYIPTQTVTYPPLVIVTTPPPPPPRPIEPLSEQAINFVCTQENGYYPIDHECDSYIQCQGGKAMKKWCPDGLNFNPATKRFEYPCSYPSEVKCVAGAVRQSPKPTEQCPRQYGFFAMDTGDCSRFIMCQEGIGTPMDCPPGLAFNDATDSCDWPANVPLCNPHVFRDFTCPSPPVDEHGVMSDIIYKYRFEQECKLYVACQRGRPRLLSCEGGLAFDPASQSCISDDLVTDCGAAPNTLSII